MEQYIPKSAVVAEIEKLVDKGKYREEHDCAYRDGNNGALYALKGKLDTLEVKEVDLEKEIQTYKNNHSYMSEYIKDVAKYFFELGLKAQKGE